MRVTYISLLITQGGMPDQTWRVYVEAIYQAVAEHCDIPFHHQSFSLSGTQNYGIIAVLPVSANTNLQDSLASTRSKFDGSRIMLISGKTVFI